MENEKLAELVIAEVLRRLKQPDAKLPAGNPSRKVMAIFTGGVIGLETGLSELVQIKNLNTALSVVLSPAAEKVIGIRRIQEALGSDLPVITTQSPYPGGLLKTVDAILVPVLTQNTAAKLAHTLSDTLASHLIFKSLLLGKPVIAAVNAADPQDCWRIQNRMAQATPALLQALKSNLQKIAAYGVRLVPVECLAAELDKGVPHEADYGLSHTASPKTVVDAAAVKLAARNGVREMILAKGSVITPLARDIARECHINLQVGGN